MRGLKRGVLKLGAVSTAKYFAPSLLSAFTPAYPEVTIKFAVGNREEIIKQLAANEIDLVIMGRPPRELETVAEPFAKHPLVIIASPDHPLADASAASSSSQLGDRAASSSARKAPAPAPPWNGCSGSGDVPFRVSMEVSSNETIKQAVMADMGISFISSHTVGLELAAGKLVILDVVGLPDRPRLVCDASARQATGARSRRRSARSCWSAARRSFRRRSATCRRAHGARVGCEAMKAALVALFWH